MNEQTEINRGYVDYLRAVNQVGAPGSTAFPSALRLKQAISLWWKRTITVLGLILITLLLEVWLRLYLILRRSKLSPLNQAAINNVDKFVEQYPFHLYPVVCKAFELACLKAELPKLLDLRSSTLEVAIGDGTLSSRVFPADAKVVGLDLSPYSLKKASDKPHVQLAIVCDCLNPPVLEGSFDVLIANNFLHHVTNKEQTLSRWSRIAAKAIFNENSPTWASGWTIPYLLKKLGRREEATRLVNEINSRGLQYLESKEVLDIRVAKSYEITHCDSYMSERTFFYCGLFSFLMRCQGPPTPADLKGLFLSNRLRWLVLPLTANLAKLLIRYDQHQDRSTDSFISYVCKSQNYVPLRAGNYLACPNCRGELSQTNQCTVCSREYSYTDGMLFLLPEELADLQQQYNFEVSRHTPKEHL
jgi:uncharacterized protein YbaR (Trm112 family)